MPNKDIVETMKTMDLFFEHPLLSTIIEEAVQSVESDDDPIPGQDEAPAGNGEQDAPQAGDKIQQLAADIQQGHLQQDDLINMYKAGQLSKEEIKQIIELAQGTGGGAEGAEGGEQQPSEEELLAQQIDQTNDMFVKFAVYDKVSELTTKLQYFHNNFSDVKSEFYERVVQLQEFLNILSSLIFNLDTAVSYQMYGSILLQLTELFDEYNQANQREQQIEKAKGLENGNS